MRPARSLAPWSALAALALPLLTPAPAHADLEADVDRLVAAWSAKPGTAVERRAPLFIEHGRVTIVRLDTPAPAASTASASPASSAPTGPARAPSATAGCTTVVLVAPRTSEIAFLTDGPRATPIPPPALPLGHPTVAPADGDAIRSKGGVALIERCGKEQAQDPLEAERLLLQSVSPRTTVEVVVVRSPGPIERPESLLAERAEGPAAPRGDAGRPLDPGPLTERLQRVEKRDRDDGAQHVVKLGLTATAAGTGELIARLGEGCHALDLVADIPPSFPRRPTDVDAEAHVSDGGRALARDRGESTDAHLDFCLGEPTEVDVTFIGASGAVPVTVVDALWPLPAGLPTEWGAQARGDIAAALRRRHAPALPPEPIATVMGVQGETMVPLTVEPGQCYLAVAALVRGDSRGLKLAVEIGDRAPRDEIADRPEAAQVAFCATVEDRAALRIEARGAQPWWLALVWRISR